MMQTDGPKQAASPFPSTAERKTEVLASAEGATVTFGPLVAVREVSFAVRSGDLVGLIGPNGAGKTTLLRAIAGIQPLTGGKIHVMGHDVARAEPEALRQVGFTPDTPVFYDNLTVRDFLRFIALGYGLDSADAEERIDFWLEKVWLSEKATQKIKALSRGMKQRVGIARTLLPNPALVLLDEPAAGLDPAGRVQFRQLLCDLREQGKAIIISSHILADMEEYCTHVGIMAHGQMLQFGTVSQIASHGDGTGRCRYTIVLARPLEGIHAMLKEISDMQSVQVERERVTFEFASDRTEAAALLAQLVSRQIPVASFVPHTPGLEEAYLRTGIRQVD